MSEFVISIDGGGTSTTAVLGTREGQVRVLDPACGCTPQDGLNWRASLSDIIRQIPPNSSVVLGISGWGEIAKYDDEVRAFMDSKLEQPALILNDVELACRAAFPRADGVLLLAGTGSMAMATHEGEMTRAGGWGHFFSDEGSAFWIGQQALAIAAAETDGRDSDGTFGTRLVAKLGAPSTRFGLLDWLYEVDTERAQIAAIAQHVDQLAESGDGTAQEILANAAEELSQLAQAAAANAGLSHRFAWCHAGSVFESDRVKEGVEARLGEASTPDQSTHAGGLRMAADAAGWACEINWNARLDEATKP